MPMTGTSNALGDYTLPSSFCTAGMIWHKPSALINQTRCGKSVPPRVDLAGEAQTTADGWNPILQDPARPAQYFSSLQMYRSFRNTTTMKSWRQQNVWFWTMGSARGRAARLAMFDAVVVWVGNQRKCLLNSVQRGEKGMSLNTVCFCTPADERVSYRPQAWGSKSTKHHENIILTLIKRTFFIRLLSERVSKKFDKTFEVC